ncbi:hypothetical protein [Occultella aeris]|nr:hypothetical protein [Occultella aeris]
MTARHLRATARAERLHFALRELDDATDHWSLIGSDVEDAVAHEAEGRVFVALRRLASASGSRLLHRAVAKAMDDLDGAYAVVTFSDEDLARKVDAARSEFLKSADYAEQIAAQMVDPPLLPVRVVRWTVRTRNLRKWWLAQRRVARAGGA